MQVWKLDESITEANDIKLEEASAEVTLLKGLKNKNTVNIGFRMAVMRPTTCFVHTENGHSLTNEDYLKPKLKFCFKRMLPPELKMETKDMIDIQGVVLLAVPMRDMQVRIWFGVVQNLAVDFHFGTTSICKCIRRIFHMD